MYFLNRGDKRLFGIPNKHVLMLLQVELFAEAIDNKAFAAGWQALSKEQVLAPDAYQLYVAAT